MEKYHEVSQIEWEKFHDALRQGRFQELDLSHINDYIRVKTDYGSRTFYPLLFFTFSFSLPDAFTWLLEHGADPNMEFANDTMLMKCCAHGRFHNILVKYGARVEIPDKCWDTIHLIWKGPGLNSTNYAMFANLFLLGLKIPEKEYLLGSSPWAEAYRVILAREAACRRACYTFILFGLLPKVVTRWMLTFFVLPSKRESCWSPLNVKMPKGFELLD